jgi:glyoxylase-like metal-dependent hydrolase (beta-lactamase superfamily II)
MEIIEGIHRVDGVNANVYVIFNQDKLVLIDTGLPRSSRKIVKYIEKTGHKPTEVSTIIITHHHIDHIGSLKNIKKTTNAKVASHELEAPIISGETVPPKPKNLFMRAFGSMIKVQPVKSEVILKENDQIDGLTVIHTPGHTPGSIALLDSKRKAIFVGDTIRSTGGKIRQSPENYSLDPAEARKSIGKIASFEFDVLLSGHGEPLKFEADKQVKRFYENFKK